MKKALLINTLISEIINWHIIRIIDIAFYYGNGGKLMQLRCLTLSALALAGIATTANAAPIAAWNFMAYGGMSGLSSGLTSPVVFAPDLGNPLPPDYGALSWGTGVGGEPSHLTINEKDPNALIHDDPDNYYRYIDPVTQGVVTPGGETIGQIMTSDPVGEVIGWTYHHNLPTNFVGTGYAAVNYHLDLYDGLNLVWESGEMHFVIEILETLNSDDPCANGEANGIGINANGCADRFRFAVLDDYNDSGDLDAGDLSLATFGDTFDAIIANFTYEGVKYNVSLTGFWDEELFKGAYWSSENGLNHMEVRAEVHVPEPATLALMGLGLVGIGASAAARRRHKALSST